MGGELRVADRALVRALHYDNVGDPDDATAREPAWRTRFDAIGARYELPFDVWLLAQGMLGDTEFGPQGNGRGMFLAKFWSYYLLASKAYGAHRVTARYDRMCNDTRRGADRFNRAQNAHAWTLAYQFSVSEQWQFAIEALEIAGSLAQRAVVGMPANARERQL